MKSTARPPHPDTDPRFAYDEVKHEAPAAGGSRSSEWFRKFAHHTSTLVGSPQSFTVAMILILVWAVTGPMFHFSDTWQLVINTGTTIVTFLMVFLIQNTQNRDARAIHLKLDELIRSMRGARNQVINLENCTEEELAELQREFERLRAREHQRGKAAGAAASDAGAGPHTRDRDAAA
jgi:low affinity Fe/Cu permease